MNLQIVMNEWNIPHYWHQLYIKIHMNVDRTKVSVEVYQIIRNVIPTCPAILLKRNKTETKWPLLRRQQFHTYFRQWKYMNFG